MSKQGTQITLWLQRVPLLLARRIVCLEPQSPIKRACRNPKYNLLIPP